MRKQHYICSMNIVERTWTHNFSDKEKKFLIAYAQGGSLEDAAIVAGYGNKVISFMGERILKRKEAREELKNIKVDLATADTATIAIDEVVEGFRAIASAVITDFYDDFGDVVDVTSIDPIKARAIKEIKRTVHPKTGAVTVTLTLHDKVAALQNLGRIGGHYAADNGQSTGDINIMVGLPGGIAGL